MAPKSNLLRRLLAKRGWLLADGATGTNLFAHGLAHGDAPEQWNLNHADKVRAHYRSFIQAGSDIVLTNTFGGTANRLRLHGLHDRVHEINWIAAQLLATEIAVSGRTVVCAGSVGPTGDLFQPLGPLTHDEGVAAFRAQMEGLRDGGADVAWIETMSSADELRAALAAATEVGLPVVCTMSFDTNGRTMMGVSPSDLVTLVRESGFDPVAFGGNCGTGAPDLMAGLLSARGVFHPDDVIVAKANCGVPEFVDGEIRYGGTLQMMADYAVMARDAGARIIGGCCGTTPEHIRAMAEALATHQRGEAPTLDQVIARLGPLTGNTADLFMTRDRRDGGPVGRGGRAGGRRGRRRD
ncbi:MAG: betaine--homocysteine S-methyltransferase [Hyphomicrobiales bacterium]|nr:betaine--homocysteine S-methyltransferase [Hyphomicrobiales bacterium]MCP5371873.1 betaine--homocysteine S-methyltransferase [Hyphomicrobiales bacterium]